MIPRYVPTYTYSDLIQSLGSCSRDDINAELCSRLATLYKVKHVFLLSSARAALYALLMAYNRPGGVLIPAYNCIVVPEAIHYAGYRAVFADIDYSSLNMTAGTLKEAITPDITVVLATHVFGIPCDIEKITDVSRQYGVLVIEDAAPAIGAILHGQTVGRFGDASIISFQSTKVISGLIGGALLIDDDELAQEVERLLQTASVPCNCLFSFAKALARKMATNSWVYPATLFAYRILHDEQLYEIVTPQTEMPTRFLTSCPRFSSTLVLRQLDRLEWNLSRRRKLAQVYQNELAGYPGLTLPVIPEDCLPAWIQFPILTDNKRAFYRHMQRNGVDLSWTFRYSCADSYGLNGFPNAQRAAKTVLGLPTYPSLPDEHVHLICNAAIRYLSKAR